MVFLRLLNLLAMFAAVVSCSAQETTAPLDKPINLLAGPGNDFESVLARENSTTRDTAEAFTFDEKGGRYRVTGKGWGYSRTKTEFSNYHLVAEFRWGESTYGVRADRARDCGVFVHINGRDGAVAGSWPRAIEVQLLESMSGNVSLLGTKLEPWVATVDGEELSGERLKVLGANWDSNWKDEKGWYSNSEKIEADFGNWNRLEIICEGATLVVKLNGTEVNRLEGLDTTSGKIGIQTELAECFFRRLELFPIGTFSEEWKPEIVSADTGYSSSGDSILPRKNPLSPEKSLAAWRVNGDYELQLVAVEPLVCDPVDVVWDERGRMFVSEMRDYPLPPEGGPFLSRIRLLLDADGDGKMDTAKTWADELDNLQGIEPMNGGLLATTRTALLFLRDTDGDDVADEVNELFKNNEARYNQLQISSPRRGLDNAIYLNNGLDLKEIYPVDQPEKKLSVSRNNLRLDPKTLQLEPVSGYGQFGATLDDWGRHFSSSNRNPVMFAAMPQWAVQRNPFDHISQGHVDIAPTGEDAKVYPFELSHTTSVAHAGTHTAACGLAVYRGNLMPNLTGNVFVCEPTAQLITRSVMTPVGASFSVNRIGENVDFLVSSDEWSRPVNLRNGPDGALYICDMYRRFIDHSRFFPEEFSKSHYMRAGVDQGRIYRLVPKGREIKKIDPLPEEPRDLAGLLQSQNAWQRIHAQRVLVERQPAGVEPVVRQVFQSSEFPQGRLHAFWTLVGLGKLAADDVARALNDPHPAIVENAIPHSEPEDHAESIFRIAGEGPARARYAALLEIGYAPMPAVTNLFKKTLLEKVSLDDPWIRAAILTGSEERAGELLIAVLKAKVNLESESGMAFIREFSSAVGARGDSGELANVLAALQEVEETTIRFALADGLSQGLKKSSLKTKTLAAFIASPPSECADLVGELEKIVSSAESVVTDDSRLLSERLAAIPLASQQGFETFQPIAGKLLSPNEPFELSQAVLNEMTRFKREDLADFFFARWSELGPESQRSAVGLLAAGDTLVPLMMKMKAGEINPRLMEPIKTWSYARSTNPKIKKLAIELFGTADADRAKVIDDYKTVFDADQEPDLENGKAVLTRAACITCHRVGGMGAAVGPDLADVKIKPAIGLLTDILDPNRAVDEQWISHTVTTVDGIVFNGIITGDDNTNISIKLPGGVVQTFPRETVEKIESSGTSLMPSGLESVISKKDMFDLIGFLKAR